MKTKPLPKEHHKAAHYYYGDGKQLQLFHCRRGVYIRDENGDYPVCPVRGTRYPHPSEENGGDGDESYDTLGLYYNYTMPHSGWSGDC